MSSEFCVLGSTYTNQFALVFGSGAVQTTQKDVLWSKCVE